MQAATPGGYVDFKRFGHLREAARADAGRAVDDVAEEFEAMFVDLMLKAARAADMEGGLFDSSEMKTYREMLDQQIARTMAQNHELGIGPIMARQFRALAGQAADAQATDGAPADDRPRFTPRYAPTVDYAGATAAPPFDGTGLADAGVREGFIARLSPHAQAAAARLGVAPAALVAQAALETGWGAHVIRHADGRSSHNYFGIKAGAGWRGDVVKVPTTEYIGGRAVTVNAAFRAYDNASAAFDDYVRLIGGNPRYRDVVLHGASAHRYAAELAAAGYATDPAYANKIIAILDGGLANDAAVPSAQVSN